MHCRFGWVRVVELQLNYFDYVLDIVDLGDSWKCTLWPCHPKSLMQNQNNAHRPNRLRQSESLLRWQLALPTRNFCII